MIKGHYTDSLSRPFGPMPPKDNVFWSGRTKWIKMINMGFDNLKFFETSINHKGYIHNDEFRKTFKVERSIPHYGLPGKYPVSSRRTRNFNGILDNPKGVYRVGNTKYAFQFLDLVYSTWRFISLVFQWYHDRFERLSDDFFRMSKTFLSIIRPELSSSWYNRCQFSLRCAKFVLIKRFDKGSLGKTYEPEDRNTPINQEVLSTSRHYQTTNMFD